MSGGTGREVGLSTFLPAHRSSAHPHRPLPNPGAPAQPDRQPPHPYTAHLRPAPASAQATLSARSSGSSSARHSRRPVQAVAQLAVLCPQLRWPLARRGHGPRPAPVPARSAPPSSRRWTSAHSQRMSSSCRARRDATASAARASAAMAASSPPHARTPRGRRRR